MARACRKNKAENVIIAGSSSSWGISVIQCPAGENCGNFPPDEIECGFPKGDPRICLNGFVEDRAVTTKSCTAKWSYCSTHVVSDSIQINPEGPVALSAPSGSMFYSNKFTLIHKN